MPNHCVNFCSKINLVITGKPFNAPNDIKGRNVQQALEEELFIISQIIPSAASLLPYHIYSSDYCNSKAPKRMGIVGSLTPDQLNFFNSQGNSNPPYH